MSGIPEPFFQGLEPKEGRVPKGELVGLSELCCSVRLSKCRPGLFIILANSQISVHGLNLN